MTGYRVWCDICGREYDERDTVGVTFHYDPPRWECYDEALCFERKADLDQAITDIERSIQP